MDIRVPTFRVYPAKGPWYWKVYLFHRRASMHKMRRLLQEEDNASKMRRFKFEAVCSAYRSKDPKNKWQFGVVMFHRGYMGGGVVAHEFAHAVNYWYKSARRGLWRKIPLDPREDEVYARMLGDLVRQFWVAYWKHNPVHNSPRKGSKEG